MGLHDMDTMQKVEEVVHTYDREAIIYGEGWQMMVNAYGNAVSAHQGNIGKIRPTNNAIGTIAVFNDTMRVGLKGESDDASKGYISGNTGYRDKVLFGVNGGSTIGASGSWWVVNNDMVVNYLSAHDNSTLWDKLKISNGTSSDAIRARMNRLGATILFTSKGIVFFQAGEEMLRSKPNAKCPTGYDHNSYKSSDEINNLKWETLDGKSLESQMVDYYAGLCAIRTKMNIFTDHTANFSVYKHNDNAGYNIIIRDNNGGVAVIVFNPDNTAKNFTLPSGDFHMIGDGVVCGITSLDVVNGQISIPGYSAKIFVNDKVLNSVGK
jgi:pullulanase